MSGNREYQKNYQREHWDECHGQIVCTICKILVRRSNMARHKKTKTHQRMEQGENRLILCEICAKEILCRNWNTHLNGDRHRKQSIALKRCEEQRNKLERYAKRS